MHGCGARNIRFKFREPLPEEAPQIDRLQVLSRKSKVGHITERPLGTAVNVRPHKTAFRKGSLDVLHALVVAVFQNEGCHPVLDPDQAIADDTRNPDASFGIECESVRKDAAAFKLVEDFTGSQPALRENREPRDPSANCLLWVGNTRTTPQRRSVA